MAEQLTDKERFSQLKHRVLAKYGRNNNLLAYAWEYIAFLEDPHKKDIPRGWSGLGWMLRPGRPHWQDSSVDSQICTWDVELRNIGREEHDYDDPPNTQANIDWLVNDRVCRKCGLSRGASVVIMSDTRLLCRGYRE